MRQTHGDTHTDRVAVRPGCLALSTAFMISLVGVVLLLPAAVTEQLLKVVYPGDDVTLPCQSDGAFRAIEWTRSDLKAPEYILFYSDGRLVPTYQKSCFKNRVALRSSALQKGDFSLLLTNVTSSDKGIYKCLVASATSRHKRATITEEPVVIINLMVASPNTNGDENQTGYVHHGYVISAVLLVLVSSVVGFFVGWKIHRKQKAVTVGTIELLLAQQESPVHNC